MPIERDADSAEIAFKPDPIENNAWPKWAMTRPTRPVPAGLRTVWHCLEVSGSALLASTVGHYAEPLHARTSIVAYTTRNARAFPIPLRVN